MQDNSGFCWIYLCHIGVTINLLNGHRALLIRSRFTRSVWWGFALGCIRVQDRLSYLNWEKSLKKQAWLCYWENWLGTLRILVWFCIRVFGMNWYRSWRSAILCNIDIPSPYISSHSASGSWNQSGPNDSGRELLARCCSFVMVLEVPGNGVALSRFFPGVFVHFCHFCNGQPCFCCRSSAPAPEQCLSLWLAEWWADSHAEMQAATTWVRASPVWRKASFSADRGCMFCSFPQNGTGCRARHSGVSLSTRTRVTSQPHKIISVSKPLRCSLWPKENPQLWS